MVEYHAVMIDETGCEFGVTFMAANRGAAYCYLAEMYPESECDQLEDPQQMAEREDRLQEYTQRCMDDPYYEIDHCHEWD